MSDSQGFLSKISCFHIKSHTQDYSISSNLVKGNKVNDLKLSGNEPNPTCAKYSITLSDCTAWMTGINALVESNLG
jgi:hypothetical protein